MSQTNGSGLTFCSFLTCSKAVCPVAFCVYTGNTEYGVQNLEYDRFTDGYFMAVYPGFKKNFPNFALMELDASVPPVRTADGEMLMLKKAGQCENGIHGWHFPYGSTGI